MFADDKVCRYSFLVDYKFSVSKSDIYGHNLYQATAIENQSSL